MSDRLPGTFQPQPEGAPRGARANMFISQLVAEELLGGCQINKQHVTSIGLAASWLGSWAAGSSLFAFALGWAIAELYPCHRLDVEHGWDGVVG